MTYDVTFTPDVAAQLADDDFHVVEVERAPESWHDPPAPEQPRLLRHDGQRLVLGLGPDDTSDDTYTTVEVASTKRFDQDLLDRLAAEGSMRVVIPGREAIFRDVVFSPEFGDDRAAKETVTAGLVFQSWRGISEGVHNAAARGERPAYMAASIMYLGGPGLVPAVMNRSLTGRRRLLALVIDFNVGMQWTQSLDVDPCSPHDYTIRWYPDRDVSFRVGDTEVARYRDGRRQVAAMKLLPKFRRGIDLIGHRYLTADPCHIDAWLNCSATGNTPDVHNGRRFRHRLSLSLAGFGIRPIHLSDREVDRGAA
ncbi:MAG: hypothetical protein KY469_13165 [Actinobacteria bacterium]|nr:hypothetical protein [Actinomycetota bacterium]